MEHALKGCCTHNLDLPSDTGRLEGSHKVWGELQKGVASGLAHLLQQGSHLVLGRNLRVALGNGTASEFILSTDGELYKAGSMNRLSLTQIYGLAGSQQLGMIDDFNSRTNILCPASPPLPRFPQINSNEVFGLVA